MKIVCRCRSLSACYRDKKVNAIPLLYSGMINSGKEGKPVAAVQTICRLARCCQIAAEFRFNTEYVCKLYFVYHNSKQVYRAIYLC